MPAANISSVAVPVDGYNLTDSADFTTLVAGAGNGVTFDYAQNAVIVCKNDTGGASVFTFKLTTADGYSDLGITPGDFTLAVANAKTFLIKPSSLMQNASGKVTIECDVAGKVLVMQP